MCEIDVVLTASGGEEDIVDEVDVNAGNGVLEVLVSKGPSVPVEEEVDESDEYDIVKFFFKLKLLSPKNE